MRRAAALGDRRELLLRIAAAGQLAGRDTRLDEQLQRARATRAILPGKLAQDGGERVGCPRGIVARRRDRARQRGLVADEQVRLPVLENRNQIGEHRPGAQWPEDEREQVIGPLGRRQGGDLRRRVPQR